MDISARVRRKVWPETLKREIVEAACAPGASVSVVARRYDVNANLVFTWRRLYRKIGGASAPAFLPVMVTADQPAATPAAQSAAIADAIEIEMPGGYRVRCGRNVKAASLRVVLDALERR